MTAASNANISLTGTATENKGSRSAKITVQTPGYLRYEEQNCTLTFDGTQFNSRTAENPLQPALIQTSTYFTEEEQICDDR